MVTRAWICISLVIWSTNTQEALVNDVPFGMHFMYKLEATKHSKDVYYEKELVGSLFLDKWSLRFSDDQSYNASAERNVCRMTRRRVNLVLFCLPSSDSLLTYKMIIYLSTVEFIVDFHSAKLQLAVEEEEKSLFV